jgi:hypothetical protein
VLGDEAREEKRVERAFEKNWPDLKAKLAAIPPPKAAPHRPPEEMLAEVLEVVRGLARRPERSERPDTSARGVITGDTVASPALDFLEMSRAEHARRQAVLRATGGLGLGGRVADLEALNAWKTEGAKAVAAVDAMSAQFADGAKAVDAMNARLAEGAKAVNAMSETFAEAEKLAAKLDALNDPIQLKKDDKKS